MQIISIPKQSFNVACIFTQSGKSRVTTDKLYFDGKQYFTKIKGHNPNTYYYVNKHRVRFI